MIVTDIKDTHNINDIVELIQKACQRISHYIRHCNPTDMAKLIGNDNISGDSIKILDKLSQTFLFEALVNHTQIYGLISEEHDTIYKTKHSNGNYIVAFDPLDGSSNIEFNITTGTIFAIYQLDENKQINSGRNIVSSGYCLYGGITQFVRTDIETDSVVMYRLNENNQTSHQIENGITMPNKGKYYSVNMANMNKWLRSDTKDKLMVFNNEGYSLRYVGSMVADAHRVLMRGGLFMYPGDIKNKTGKIRFYYEAYPFAFLIEKAGGICTDFHHNILDIVAPYDIHASTPIVLGSKYEMNKII
jgi:fructose-1,6-bisphosphatase I